MGGGYSNNTSQGFGGGNTGYNPTAINNSYQNMINGGYGVKGLGVSSGGKSSSSISPYAYQPQNSMVNQKMMYGNPYGGYYQGQGMMNPYGGYSSGGILGTPTPSSQLYGPPQGEQNYMNQLQGLNNVNDYAFLASRYNPSLYNNSYVQNPNQAWTDWSSIANNIGVNPGVQPNMNAMFSNNTPANWTPQMLNQPLRNFREGR